VAQHVVSAIAAAMGVDVAMIDDDCRLVATSKTFLEKRGTVINRSFIRSVITRDVFVLPNCWNSCGRWPTSPVTRFACAKP